ncbi:MAG TPA: TonB-dependent receptor, partial [Bryobacteraceae bacterium]|nr:TonB-dependent receptor [Bryobacteraceae bacterium]
AMEQTLSTPQKALQLNLDAQKFGTFAEIGAGQEVARWFFHVGRASGTVAKTISAYDMAISDDLYGPTNRFVSRARLESMLTREFDQLLQRLPHRESDVPKALFVFADTVTTQSRTRGGHGWMGVRFQDVPGGETSDIIIHFAMSDPETVRQQESAGILGVNLIHAALYSHPDPRAVLNSLMDGLTRRRIEVDMIKFSGPVFRGVDNRLMSLHLVEHALTDAAMFTASGEVVQPSEVLYGRGVLIERGSFRPVTNVTVDMLSRAERQQEEDHPESADEPVVLMEMTLHNLMSEKIIDPQDFLDRADLLGALGKTVMISNFTRFDRVTEFLRKSTQTSIAMVMGVPTLNEIFDEKYYVELPGGVLEGFGRLFQGPVRLLVYPTKDSSTGEILSMDSISVGAHQRKLLEWLCENGSIEPIRDYDPAQLHITPAEVLRLLQAGDPAWRGMVPAPVADLISRRRLFGALAA